MRRIPASRRPEAIPSASYEQSELKPAPRVGDVILCSAGYAYEIKDVSKYNNSMFATEETEALPTSTCDWNLLDQPALPAPEARHFTAGGKEYLFVRNLYETKRMQYTLYNAIGDNPQTWKNGRPVTLANGDPMVRINLSISNEINAPSFWPWRGAANRSQNCSTPVPRANTLWKHGTSIATVLSVIRSTIFM